MARWDDEHKCTNCGTEAFVNIYNIRPEYDYDYDENLVETGRIIYDEWWLETPFCPFCGSEMENGG